METTLEVEQAAITRLMQRPESMTLEDTARLRSDRPLLLTV
jgi:hypothetical protein